MNKKNNEQIDNTSYYLLPCKRQLEDFIWTFRDHIGFHMGNALKYAYRAGKKDGEAMMKDYAKVKHYCRFMSSMMNVDFKDVHDLMLKWLDYAIHWDGKSDSMKYIYDENVTYKETK